MVSGLLGTPQPLGLPRRCRALTSAAGSTTEVKLALQVAPASLRQIRADGNTVALWNWQGPSGKLIKDPAGDDDLTLTWTNIGGDRRMRCGG